MATGEIAWIKLSVYMSEYIGHFYHVYKAPQAVNNGNTQILFATS